MRSMRLIALVLIVIASLSHGDVVIPVFPEDENLSMRCGPYTALLNAMTERTPPAVFTPASAGIATYNRPAGLISFSHSVQYPKGRYRCA